MSTTAKLDIFTLKIRDKGNRSNYLNLNDIASFKLIEELHSYISKNIYLFKIDNELERTSRIEKNELEDNSLFCRIKIGKFGESSEIVDTVSGSGIFHKEKEHSDTIPLFFHLYISGEDCATIHIQRTGNRTLLPELKNIISTVLFNLREDQFTFELKPLKEVVSIKDFIDGNRGEITSISIKLEDETESDFMEQPVITLKTKQRKQFPAKITKLIATVSENSNYKKLESILPKGVQGSSIVDAKLELKVENRGKVKTKLTNKISLTESITLDIDSENQDKFGHPAFNFLKEISIKSMVTR